MNYSKAFLGGRLTRDPELRHSQGGMAIASLSVAVNEKRADKETVSFIDCTAFAKTAENVHRFFKKGDPIFVEGRLKQDSWEAQDGSRRSKLVVYVDRFEFLGGKGEKQAEPAAQAKGEQPRMYDDPDEVPW